MVDLLNNFQDVYSKWEARGGDARSLAENRKLPFIEKSPLSSTSKTNSALMGNEAGEGFGATGGRSVASSDRKQSSFPRTRPFTNYKNSFSNGTSNGQSNYNSVAERFKTMPIAYHHGINASYKLGCTKCSPLLRKSLVGQEQSLGLKNILLVSTQDSVNNFLTRKLYYFAYVLKTNANFVYPDVTRIVLDSQRVLTAIENAAMQNLEDQSARNLSYNKLLAKHRQRAKKLLDGMKSKISTLLIRITGYVLFKMFSRLFMSIEIQKSQLELIKKINQTLKPVIYLPLHRSHLDYLLVTFILYVHEIRAPVVAAGDNLRISIFGAILRRLGAFFIKRKLDPKMGKKDFVYRALLQTYMEQCLMKGHSMEFFIEGGRSRSGKACLPKAGLLSVVVDAYKDGALEDAYIVPIGLNYDKLIDNGLLGEQMGKPKVMESFALAVKSIWNILNSNYGNVSVDFARPFSLKEFILAAERFPSVSPRTFLNNPPSPKATIRRLPSSSSLYGTDVVVEEQRILVKGLAEHILHDAVQSTALMSTNLTAFLLLNKYRKGVLMKTFVQDFTWLCEEIKDRGRNVGFTGSSLDVVNHAIGLLGDNLIKVQRSEDYPDLAFIQPNLELPYVVELAYYSNVAISAFLGDSIITAAMYSIAGEEMELLYECKSNFTISKNRLLSTSLDLSHVLQYEFILTPPCISLEASLEEVIECFQRSDIFVPEFEGSDGLLENAQSTRYRRPFDGIDDEDEFNEVVEDAILKVNSGNECVKKLKLYRNILAPFIEGYWHLSNCLKHLVQNEMEERKFISLVQKSFGEKAKQGSIEFTECIAAETLKNGLNLLQSWKVIDSFMQDNIKIIFLSESYDNEERLTDVIAIFAEFRK
ncbi:hypothetical protein CHUAL_010050 [Chamberlinius hualienensis]